MVLTPRQWNMWKEEGYLYNETPSGLGRCRRWIVLQTDGEGQFLCRNKVIL